MSTATAAGIRGRETRVRASPVSVPSSAAVVAFVSPVHAGRTTTNTYDFASVLTVAGDDPVNSSDPTGLYDCSGKPANYTVNRYSRGSQRYVLQCGTQQYGIRHIQDGGHFGGDVSNVVRNLLIPVTISRGKVANVRGSQVAFDHDFIAFGGDIPPESEPFTIRVVVSNQLGGVVTARSLDPQVDGNLLDNCNWAGIQSCGADFGYGGGGTSFATASYVAGTTQAAQPCSNTNQIAYIPQ